MTSFPVTATDTLIGGDAWSYQFQAGASVTDGFTIQDLYDNIAYHAGASITDGFLIGKTISASGHYHVTSADVIKLSAVVAKGIIGTLGDTIHIHDSRSIALAVTILAK